jgi:hypothetical protein
MSAARLVSGGIEMNNARAIKMAVNPDLIMHLSKRPQLIGAPDLAVASSPRSILSTG